MSKFRMIFEQGMFSARGRYMLFADADGASKFSDFTKLENQMKNVEMDKSNRAVICGSRAHLEEESIAQVDISCYIQMISRHTFLLITEGHIL